MLTSNSSPRETLEVPLIQRETFRSLLISEFAKRKQRNPAFSVRAFANYLKVGKTTLNEVLNGTRSPSPTSARKIGEALGLSPAAIRQLRLGNQGRAPQPVATYDQLADDEFEVIADWKCLAILSLSKIPNVPYCPKTIGERLGVSSLVTEAALDRLLRLGFIENREGYLRRSSNDFHTRTDVPSRARRAFHESHLEIARNALDKVDISERDFSSLTMAISKEDLPRAKELVLKFRSEMGKLLHHEAPTDVYHLAVQLYPLTGMESPTQN